MFKKKHKDIDLLKAYQSKKEPSKIGKSAKLLLPPLLVLLVFVSIFSVNQLYVNDVNKKIDVIEDEIDAYKSKISLVGDEDYNTLAKIQEQNTNIQSIVSTLRTYPKLTSGLMFVFNQKLLDGMNLKSIFFDDGTINVSLDSINVLNIESYIRSIRESGVFTSVDYRGYQEEETSTAEVKEEVKEGEDPVKIITSKKYGFTITCQVKGV